MKPDRDQPQILSREQCLALVPSVPIGRVVYTDRALPAVMPMNFVLDGDEIVIRTGSGTALAAGMRNAVVAFQVDEFDPATNSGWSVTITGQARLVDDPDDAARLALLPLRPWAKAPNRQFIRIPIQHVSGRRLGRVAPLAGENIAGENTAGEDREDQVS